MAATKSSLGEPEKVATPVDDPRHVAKNASRRQITSTFVLPFARLVAVKSATRCSEQSLRIYSIMLVQIFVYQEIYFNVDVLKIKMIYVAFFSAILSQVI